MFETALNTITSFFDKRFITTIFLPCLTICSIFTFLIIFTQGIESFIQFWNVQSIEVQVFIIITYLLLVYLLAYFLLVFLRNITKLYEGYWDNILGLSESPNSKIRKKIYTNTIKKLYDKRKEYYIKEYEYIRDYLDNRSANDSKSENYFNELYYYYPFDKEYIMPTRLGNILQSSETYSLNRYGIDAVTGWPRLYPLLSESSKNMIVENKSALDSMLIISFLGLGFSIVSGLYLIFIKPSWPLFLISFWGGLIIWWFAYRNAIIAALGYSESIKSAFDLNHVNLIKALGYEIPKSIDDEKKEWTKITQFIFYTDTDMKCDVPYSNSTKIESKYDKDDYG